MTPEERQALRDRLMEHAMSYQQSSYDVSRWIPSLVDDIIVPLLKEAYDSGYQEGTRDEGGGAWIDGREN